MPVPDAAVFQALEEQLLRPEVRRSDVALAQLLTDDFVEIGRSGRVYTRDEVVTALAAEAPLGRVVIGNLRVRLLSAEAVLVTYVSHRAGEAGTEARRTLRSSIWLLRDGRWRMAFHQGTPAQVS